jgi:hypothetical protein
MERERTIPGWWTADAAAPNGAHAHRELAHRLAKVGAVDFDRCRRSVSTMDSRAKILLEFLLDRRESGERFKRFTVTPSNGGVEVFVDDRR